MEAYKVMLQARRFVRLQIRTFDFWMVVLGPLAIAIVLPIVTGALVYFDSKQVAEGVDAWTVKPVTILFEPRLSAGAELLKGSLELDEGDPLATVRFKVKLVPLPDSGADGALKTCESAGLRGELTAYVLLATEPTAGGKDPLVKTTLFVEPLNFVKANLKTRLAVASSLFDVLEIEGVPERKFALNGNHFDGEFGAATTDKPERQRRIFTSLLMFLFVFAARAGSTAVTFPLCAGLAKEKDQCTIETLLTAYSCREIIAGRLFGAMALSVPILVGYTALGAAFGTITGLIPLTAIAWLYPLFIADSAFYSASYFFAGCIGTSRESAMRLGALLSLVMFGSSLGMIVVLTAPNSPEAIGLCRIPLLATTAIPVRIAIGTGNNYFEYGLVLAATLLLAVAVFQLTNRVVTAELLILKSKRT